MISHHEKLYLSILIFSQLFDKIPMICLNISNERELDYCWENDYISFQFMRNKKITSISSILALNNNSRCMYTLCDCMREKVFVGTSDCADIMSQSEKNFRFVFFSLNQYDKNHFIKKKLRDLCFSKLWQHDRDWQARF